LTLTRALVDVVDVRYMRCNCNPKLTPTLTLQHGMRIFPTRKSRAGPSLQTLKSLKPVMTEIPRHHQLAPVLGLCDVSTSASCLFRRGAKYDALHGQCIPSATEIKVINLIITELQPLLMRTPLHSHRARTKKAQDAAKCASLLGKACSLQPSLSQAEALRPSATQDKKWWLIKEATCPGTDTALVPRSCHVRS
jgi:hypothetical protein